MGDAWQQNRKRALRRDRARCQECGQKAFRVHVHHKVPRSRGGTHDLENLVTLCPGCHADRHAAYTCCTCGAIIHDKSGVERGVMDKKGGSWVTICDACWSRIERDGLDKGCRLCFNDLNDTRYNAALAPGLGLPCYELCDGCRKRLIFDHQFSTMEFFDMASPIEFRHWEAENND